MPLRRSTLGRREPIRPPRRAVLIVIGADRTETAYLKGLRIHPRRGAVRMKIVEKPAAPDQLVEYTRTAFTLGDFDEVWCVTDPCFELWLLLHHEDCAAPRADCREVHTRLRKHLPRYDKTRLRFGDFAAGLDQASRRAEKLGADHTRNPSTGVWRLVDAVLEKQ